MLVRLPLMAWLVAGLCLGCAVSPSRGQAPPANDPALFVGTWKGQARLKVGDKFVGAEDWTILISHKGDRWVIDVYSGVNFDSGPDAPHRAQVQVVNSRLTGDYIAAVDGDRYGFQIVADLAGHRLTGTLSATIGDSPAWRKDFILVRASKAPSPASFSLAMRPARPITSAMIDKFLDYLANQLQAAYATEESWCTPLMAVPETGPLSPPRTSWAQAAELGRAVWEQARSLQTAANKGVITLTDAQKQRLKVFGHWTAWLINRARTLGQPHDVDKIPLYSDDPACREFRYTLVYKVPPPPFPLDKPITGQVPPPPLREIVDEDEASINIEEYGKAFVKTLAIYADMYFTYGLVYTSYLYFTEGEIAPVAMVGLSYIPGAGPVLVGLLTVANEVRNFGTLSWDQHLGNLSGLLLAGLHAHQQRAEARARADPGKGMNEAPVPATVPKQLAAEIPAPEIRRFGPNNELAEIKIKLPGKGGGLGPQPIRVKIVKVGDKELFFHETTGEPIILPNEQGYKAWSALTGRRCGQDTGRPHLLQACKGTKYEAEVNAIIRDFLNPAVARENATARLVRLLNQILEDRATSQLRLLPEAAGNEPAVGNAGAQIRNAQGEVHTLKVAVGPDGKVADVTVSPPAPEEGIPRPEEFNRALTPKRGLVTPGAKLGSGGNKNVFAVEGDATKAVGILKPGKPVAAIEEEIALITDVSVAKGTGLEV